MKWQADECPDANGNITIRPADGTANGNTDEQPIATVYKKEDAALIAAAPELLAALESCLAWMEFTIPRLDKTPSGSIERMNWGGPIGKARTAIASAKS